MQRFFSTYSPPCLLHYGSSVRPQGWFSRALQSSSLCTTPSSPPCQVFVSTEPCILFNLAFEQWLIGGRVTVPTLFLWRNHKAVVIGRHQNPWTECDLSRMDREGVTLARRNTGGGAVYQDLGNSCFSFLGPPGKLPKDHNSSIILEALRNHYGIKGISTGRNDLTVHGRKFSGSAYSQTAAGVVHHGTLLRDVNLDGLHHCLTPHRLKLQSKGVTSVTSRVVNLKEINPDITYEGLNLAVIDSFLKTYGPLQTDVQQVSLASPHAKEAIFQAHHQSFLDWDWRYGKTPKFSHRFEHRFDWAMFEFHLDVKDGRISDVEIFSDCLKPDFVEQVKVALKGVRYAATDVDVALKEHLPGGEQAEEFTTWIKHFLSNTL